MSARFLPAAAPLSASEWLISVGPTLERFAQQDAAITAYLTLPRFLREKPWGVYYDLKRGIWTGDAREDRPEPHREDERGMSAGEMFARLSHPR